MRNVKLPNEGILFVGHGCHLLVDDKHYGVGRVFIAREKITWMNEHYLGIDLFYQHIDMKALPTTNENNPRPCLFLGYNKTQLNNCFIQKFDSDDDDDEDMDEEMEQDDDSFQDDTSGIKFIPQNPLHVLQDWAWEPPNIPSKATAMYDAIAECSRSNAVQQQPLSYEDDHDRSFSPTSEYSSKELETSNADLFYSFCESERNGEIVDENLSLLAIDK